jgi:hypothetical protein
MKRLPLPNFDVKVAVERCASGITIAERARVLLDAIPKFQAAETEYVALATKGKLFQLQPNGPITPLLSGELMGTIYKSHFVRTGSPSRVLYEAIRFAPPYGQCPMCGQRIVASVDHYLPQSLHPIFNLTPSNLVPACSDCNKGKLAKFAEREEELTLHPYFDDLGNERWLMINIQETVPPSIVYLVQPPSVWTPVLTARVNHHFKVMGLAELYAAQAASELADMSFSLGELAKVGGPDSVRSHLKGEFASRCARDPNSWKTALYDGLSSSEWFCTTGHQFI